MFSKLLVSVTAAILKHLTLEGCHFKTSPPPTPQQDGGSLAQCRHRFGRTTAAGLHWGSFDKIFTHSQAEPAVDVADQRHPDGSNWHTLGRAMQVTTCTAPRVFPNAVCSMDCWKVTVFRHQKRFPSQQVQESGEPLGARDQN